MNGDRSGEEVEIEPDVVVEPAGLDAEDHVPTATRMGWRSRGSAWWAARVFGLLVAVSYPVLLHLGSYYWFFRDDWIFITDRELSNPSDLMQPHNAHWTTVPVVVFRLLYAVFGVRTYLPYQMVVVAAHLTVIVLLRMVMRRAGVGPWLATAFAGAGLLFGPGQEDILWAFQIGFTGSMMFVLLQLVLADHDGPVGRRDAAALLAGLLGIMSASPSVVLVGVVTVTVLVKRGWRAALLQAGPLAGVYVIYNITFDPDTSPVPRPGASVLFEWVRSGQAELFEALGQHRPVVVALLLLLVVGTIVHLWMPGGEVDGTLWERFGTAVAPLALFASTFAFMVLSAQARWVWGPEAARASRYVYFYVICTLPVLALAAQALASRWRTAGPIAAALVLVPVPAHVDDFDRLMFGPSYHEHRRIMLTGVVTMPGVREVDRDLRPVPDPFMGRNVDVGFLLHAYDTGKLVPHSGELPPEIEHELLVRFGVQQIQEGWLPECEVHRGTEVVLEPEEGDVWRIEGVVKLSLEGWEGARPVEYGPRSGHFLVIRQPDLRLVVEPPRPGEGEVEVCTSG